MIRFRWAAVLGLAALAGCNQSTPEEQHPVRPEQPTPVKGTDQAPSSDTKPKPPEATSAAPIKTDDVKLSDEEIANIKKLPDEADQKLAMEQKVCPVGEEDGKPNHLGGMGKPIKKVVDGKTAFICCAGCEEDFDKSPAKYLAKLGK